MDSPEREPRTQNIDIKKFSAREYQLCPDSELLVPRTLTSKSFQHRLSYGGDGMGAVGCLFKVQLLYTYTGACGTLCVPMILESTADSGLDIFHAPFPRWWL